MDRANSFGDGKCSHTQDLQTWTGMPEEYKTLEQHRRTYSTCRKIRRLNESALEVLDCWLNLGERELGEHTIQRQPLPLIDISRQDDNC